MGRLLTVNMGKVNETTFKQTRTFAYNSKGQLLSATNPENGIVTYTYTSDGLLETKTDAKLAAASQKLWYVYDSYKRLIRIELEANSQRTVKTTLGYDSGANGVGRLTSALTSEGYNSYFAYDTAGRVTAQTLQFPYNPYYSYYLQAQYAYDSDGRLTNLYYPGAPQMQQPATGMHYQYSYDSLGRPLTLKYESDGTWYDLVRSAQYSAAGQLRQWQEADWAPYNWWNTMTREYDAARGWLTRTWAQNRYSQTVLDLNYGYLGDGRASSVTDAVNPGQSAAYTYDNLNRLATVALSRALVAAATGYDEFGNRLSQAKAPGSPGSPPEITLSYGESTNRITTSGYTYDLNGNITAMPGVTGIQWDVFDRMMQATANGSTTSYKYDAFGRRVAQETPNGTNWFFYDMSGRLLVTYPWMNGYQPVRTAYFAGQRVGQYTDRVGSVRYTAPIVTPPFTYSHYYPFGEEITSTANDRYKFAETFRDSDSGLDYALNRYYASSIGRFLSVDPYGRSAVATNPQSWNRYAYVLGDPINGTDPTGLVTFEVAPAGCWWEDGGSETGKQRSLVCMSNPGAGIGPDGPVLYFDCRSKAFGAASTIGGRKIPSMENAYAVLSVAQYTVATPAMIGMNWAFESNFQFGPKNHLNTEGSAAGTVDYGPMMLNTILRDNSAYLGILLGSSPLSGAGPLDETSVFGTNGGDKPFNGDWWANLAAGGNWLDYLLRQTKGDEAAAFQRYNSRDPKRGQFYSDVHQAYEIFFDCMTGGKPLN
jgi:RHS repeat-associated protein